MSIAGGGDWDNEIFCSKRDADGGIVMIGAAGEVHTFDSSGSDLDCDIHLIGSWGDGWDGIWQAASRPSLRLRLREGPAWAWRPLAL